MQKQSKWNIKKKEIVTVFIIVISCFFITEFFALLFPIEFSIWENRITDTLFRLRYRFKGNEPISPYLVSIDVINSDLTHMGISNTTYSIYGELMDILKESSIKTIGVDILFINKSNFDNKLLIDATKKLGNVFYPVILGNIDSVEKTNDFPDMKKKPPSINKFLWYPRIRKEGQPRIINSVYLPFDELVDAAKGLGHIAVEPDWDGISRQYPLFFKYKNGYIPGFSIRMLCDYLSVSPDDIEIDFNKSITLKNAVFPSGLTKDIIIPIDSKGNMYVNFTGPSRDSFLQYSSSQLLSAADPAQFYQYMADSLLIISDKTSFSKDYGPGIFESSYPLNNIHLQVINTILKENFLYLPNLFQKFLMYICLTILLSTLGLLGIKLRGTRFFIITIGFYLLYIIQSIVFFFHFAWIPYILKPSIGYFLALILLFFYNIIILTWEIRLINRERNAQKEKLIQTNKLLSLGTLASSITHEIANPNNVISLDAATLNENYLIIEDFLNNIPEGTLERMDFPHHKLSEKIKEGIDGIRRNSGRIQRIISELRNFSCKMTLYKEETINVCKVITSALFLLSYEIKRIGTVHFTPPARELPFIMGNFQHLEQVIVNLLLNACHSIGEREDKKKGTIFISLEQNSKTESIDVSIKDNGMGMTQDVLDRITEPFFSTKIEKGGTGLGLYITQKIIDKHRGRVRFNSIREEGTEVVLSFPYKKFS
ncbi:MAG: CHASE2 domain-containing protein [Spirochaetales bacterium]|nr:CHASE2 domain-containing protein [Spirochaetales bacterium]